MINIRFSNDKNKYKLIVKGHAELADAGNDIVCAGVSALVCSLAQALLDNEIKAIVTKENGYMLLSSDVTAETKIMFDMTVAGLKKIKTLYPFCFEGGCNI